MNEIGKVRLMMSDNDANRLLGRWTTDPSDHESLKNYGRVTLVFSSDDQLRYIVHAEGKDQIMMLTYRVEGDDVLITNQPSEPSEERTRFLLTPDERLILDYGGFQTRYVKS